MMIEVYHRNEDDHDRFTMDNGKIRIHIDAGPFYTTVCVYNASHRAWRSGVGRSFFGEKLEALKEARDSYKRAAIKAMISEAIDQLAAK